MRDPREVPIRPLVLVAPPHSSEELLASKRPAAEEARRGDVGATRDPKDRREAFEQASQLSVCGPPHIGLGQQVQCAELLDRDLGQPPRRHRPAVSSLERREDRVVFEGIDHGGLRVRKQTAT